MSGEKYGKEYDSSLARLREIQYKIQDIHPLFQNNYPVTIVLDKCFYIYDIPSDYNEYEFIKSELCPYPIPVGVRAAFPIGAYNDKISAVVSDDVFEAQEGYVIILHEFVHCAQYNDCESELKYQLSIVQEYKKKNDYMWEINHPFPFADQTFIDLYTRYMGALSHYDYQGSMNLRRQFKQVISKRDLEYLIWQEWKEGFARFIENKINNQLGIKENHYGSEMPYNRISFYESGSLFISLIQRDNQNIILDMKGLFVEMKKDIL